MITVFRPIICLLFVVLFSFSAFAQVTSCAQPFHQASIRILDKVMRNGYDKVNNLKISDLKASMLSDRIYIGCDTAIAFNGDGRQSAYYRTAAGQTNEPGVLLYNFIYITNHGLAAPEELRGYLLLHEYLGAINKDDLNYSYTLQLYRMAKVPLVTSSSASNNGLVQIAANGEGTSTGVGGGDWRNLQIKIRLYDQLLVDLESVPSKREKERRMKFFLTLSIELGRASHFSGYDETIFATLALYENGPIRRCHGGRGLMIYVREAYYDALMGSEEAFSYVRNFVFRYVEDERLGSSAICFKGSKDLLK